MSRYEWIFLHIEALRYFRHSEVSVKLRFKVRLYFGSAANQPVFGVDIQAGHDSESMWHARFHPLEFLDLKVVLFEKLIEVSAILTCKFCGLTHIAFGH
jgi:hypothetical protein